MSSVPVLLQECPDLIKSVEDLSDPRVIEQVIARRRKRFPEGREDEEKLKVLSAKSNIVFTAMGDANE
ncbi:hypothetical protein M0R45_001481 [Rubus argutus]|uniref:Uncharacterized protein n=1 Tax=Rubus argutus TaxID=59490 RepID=A0AAW1VKE5_RUBAR